MEAGITQALDRTMKTQDASVLVVGYAAHGREQAGQSLDVIHEALKKDSLKAGSTVVLHVSGLEGQRVQSEALEKLQVELQKKDISVVVARAPRTLQDVLQNETPSTFKNKAKKIESLEQAGFLQAFDREQMPLSKAAETGARTTSLQALQNSPILDAKNLMVSLQGIIGEKGMAEKVKVLTDSNDALQNAAHQAGVPAGRRIKQEKNDTLFNIKASEKGKNSRLAGIFREKEKAILGKMENALEKIGAKPKDSREKIRNRTVNYLLKNAPNAAGEPINGKTQGVLCHESVRYNYQNKSNIKNIVYISDEHNQELIAEHIKAQMEKEPPLQSYKDTMFVFCGPDAVPGVDAMSLAQVADADGIFSQGAPEERAHDYQLGNTGSRARAMAVIPPGPDVPTITPEEFLKNLDASVETWLNKANTKYENGNTMEALNSRIDRSNSVSAAHNSLFSDSDKKDTGIKPAVHIDLERDSSIRRANERLRKIMQEIMDRLRDTSSGNDALENEAIELSIGRNGDSMLIPFDELPEHFSTKEKLMKTLTNDGENKLIRENKVEEKDLPLLADMKDFLTTLASEARNKEALKADRDAFNEPQAELTTRTFTALRDLKLQLADT
ncbi:hypothetical protein [Massilia sp. erpn]|uniref:hypothetical protein n=1 Tax=Massilia sp. erpn TaxID=2738142 RepID=UPI002103780A|nr:hypothetical protein [Massilia sp. erpn]UTY59679.1 hypothetical protein HPQ68_22375 [Massilia sp. erpn]